MGKKRKWLISALILTNLSAVLLVNAAYPHWLSQVREDPELHIVVVLKTNDLRSEYWQTVAAGARMAADEFGVKSVIRGTSAGAVASDQAKLVREIDEQEEADAYIIAPLNCGEIQPVIVDLKASKKRVVTIDSSFSLCGADMLIESNYEKMGRTGGELLGTMMPRNANAAVLSCMPGGIDDAGMQRKNGAIRALGEQEHIASAQFYACSGGDENDAYQFVKELLLKDQRIDGIIGVNEAAVLGAARAIREETADYSIRLVALDHSIHVTKLLEEGIVQAAIVEKPFNIGYLSMQAAIKLARNEMRKEKLELDTLVVTKENMYSLESQTLLFPFFRNR